MADACGCPHELNKLAIQQLLRARLPSLQAIYAFGSQIDGSAGPDSDLDLAVLVSGYAAPVMLWELSGEIADLADCSVDLLDFRAASTVMQYRILTTGQRWWSADSWVDIYEAGLLSDKTELDCGRADLLADVQREGRIYGR
ncbi:MAG: nucleotidyltransferase domain-containing protein [Rhodocyclaceae bacterium]|nr:nucleotidyltransferase domain-containing protein [Rhodocyclaceae bacterium]